MVLATLLRSLTRFRNGQLSSLCKRSRIALNALKRFYKYAETHTGNKLQSLQVLNYTSDRNRLKVLRTDNGDENLSNKFRAYLSEHGIHHQLTVAYNPQQNGVAERMNRTLMNLVRSMLHHKSIEKKFPITHRLWRTTISVRMVIISQLPTSGLMHTAVCWR